MAAAPRQPVLPFDDERVPIDQPVRDRIRDAHDATLFIEAGAGAGKTRALVDRIVAMVSSGTVPLRRVAAITFTEAAAAELRDRVRVQLEREAAAGSEPCRAALDELDDATITTLHGFAQRILAEHPLEAGLPPTFEVCDEIAAAIAFDERWVAFLAQLLDDPEWQATMLVASVLDMRFDWLRRLARCLDDHLDRLGGWETSGSGGATPLTSVPTLDVTDVVAGLQAALAARDECREPTDTLFVHMEILEEHVAALASADDDLDRLELLAHGPPYESPRRGNKKNWREGLDDIRAGLDATEQVREQLLGEVRADVLAPLVAAVVAFTRRSADARADEGVLEFRDLLVRARDVLAGNADVRRRLHERFDVLLVDEFQDTDPVQVELAALLAAADDASATTELGAVPVGDGRLVTVGDAKQSIYRFRRADVALYQQVRVALQVAPAQLVTNFRSVPGIVSWINAAFAPLMSAAPPGTQAEYVHLVPWRDPVAGVEIPVSVLGGPLDDLRTDEMRAIEAADVAATIAAVERDEWKVVDPSTGAVRTAQRSDVAVLLPTRTALPALEAALEAAGIPARIESQSLVYATVEVHDLVTLLTAIDDPTDEVAVVAALRTPSLGCTDRELAEFHHAGGSWDYRVEVPDGVGPSHAVPVAMAVLRGFHERRWWSRVDELLTDVAHELRFFELALAHSRPRDHWRRVRFLLDQARAWSATGGTTVRGFVSWVADQAAEEARAVEMIVPEPDDDAVRILTIHGAKGLEFPIVILTGLNVKPREDHPPALWRDDGGLEVRIGVQKSGFATAGYKALWDREVAHGAAEQIRLLYVGATRARDHLVVSLYHCADVRCLAASLLAVLPEGLQRELSYDGVAEEPIAAEVTAPTIDADEVLVARARWIEAREALLATASRPATVSATSLAHAEEPTTAVPGGRGGVGTAIGRAVHDVLQHVDLETDAELATLAARAAETEGIPEHAATVERLARAAWDSATVRDAVASKRWWREVPVVVPIGDVVLEGFIDLLYETPNGLVVVDYKTDAVRGDALDQAATRYSTQLAAYALALEQALGRPVARAVLLFVRPDGATVVEVTDLPGVQATLTSSLTGPFPHRNFR